MTTEVDISRTDIINIMLTLYTVILPEVDLRHEVQPTITSHERSMLRRAMVLLGHLCQIPPDEFYQIYEHLKRVQFMDKTPGGNA